jgi:hypothetical protein
MRRYFIHVQAIYPALLAAIGIYTCSYILLRYINPQHQYLTGFIMWFFGGWVVLFILDSIQRFRHYQSAVRYLQHHAADVEKLLLHEELSWCTRESAKAACRQYSEQLYQQAICFYVNKGIYYYHLLPQNLCSKNSPLFQSKWWRVAFFDFRKKDYLKDLHQAEHVQKNYRGYPL